MIIKDLILQYKMIAFICNNKNDFCNFVEESTKDIEYSKYLIGNGGVYVDKYKFVEDKNYIYKYHLRFDKIIILIIFKQENGYDEYQFYSRNFYDYDLYKDWDRYEIINYSYLLRNDKIKNIIYKMKNKMNEEEINN